MINHKQGQPFLLENAVTVIGTFGTVRPRVTVDERPVLVSRTVEGFERLSQRRLSLTLRCQSDFSLDDSVVMTT